MYKLSLFFVYIILVNFLKETPVYTFNNVLIFLISLPPSSYCKFSYLSLVNPQSITAPTWIGSLTFLKQWYRGRVPSCPIILKWLLKKVFQLVLFVIFQHNCRKCKCKLIKMLFLCTNIILMAIKFVTFAYDKLNTKSD